MVKLGNDSHELRRPTTRTPLANGVEQHRTNLRPVLRISHREVVHNTTWAAKVIDGRCVNHPGQRKPEHLSLFASHTEESAVISEQRGEERSLPVDSILSRAPELRLIFDVLLPACTSDLEYFLQVVTVRPIHL